MSMKLQWYMTIVVSYLIYKIAIFIANSNKKIGEFQFLRLIILRPRGLAPRLALPNKFPKKLGDFNFLD